MTLALALAAWLVLPALPFLAIYVIRPAHHDTRRDDGADLLGAVGSDVPHNGGVLK